MSKRLKPTTTAAQQIALLCSRGMLVDEGLAQQWLANVSYYRLSAYWYPARARDADGHLTDRFVTGTKFSDAVALYEADRKLRTLVHDAIERVEITMRTRIGEVLCFPDPLSYTDRKRFRQTFKHPQWIRTTKERVARAEMHNEAIKHYRNEYGGRYPFWVLAEVLDFADISRMFEGLPSQDQRTIAEDLGFVVNLDALSRNQQRKVKRQSLLARWLEQLTIIRNACAHHARLWNKSFVPAPTAALKTQPQFQRLPDPQSERLFGALLVMNQILQVTSPGTTWLDKVTTLINEDFLPNPLVTPSALGLPQAANPA